MATQEYYRCNNELSLEKLPIPDHQKRSLRTVFNILERTASDLQTAKKQEQTILELLDTPVFGRQNRQSQLGLLKSPTDIQTATDLRRFASVLAKEGFGVSNIIESTTEAMNIGGTRGDHATKTAEFCALVGEQVGLDNNEIFHFSIAGLVHDFGHPVLSHCGEFAIEIALSCSEVKERLTPEEKDIPLNHEKRTIYFLEKDPFLFQILKQDIVDKEFLFRILSEEKFGLGIADTMAYLYWDSRQINGARPLPDELVSQLISFLGYDRDRDVLTVRSLAEISRFYEFMVWRLRHYLLYYLNPETLKIEAPTIEGLSNLIKEGKLTVTECLTGTDETVSLKARRMAESNPTKYRNFLLALKGIAPPRSISFSPNTLSSSFEKETSIISFKEKLIKELLNLGVELEEKDLVVVLPTQDPYKKVLRFYVQGGEIEVKIDEGLSAHPQQGKIIICFADEVYRKEARIEEKIASLVSKEGRPGIEVEDKWLVSDEKILHSLGEMREIAGFIMSEPQTAILKDLYLYYDLRTGDYLRLREAVINGKKTHSLTFKLGETEKGESVERLEHEISVDETVFERFITNPNLLFSSDLKPIEEFCKWTGKTRFEILTYWLHNKRTIFNLKKGDEEAELVLDRIMLSEEKEPEFLPEEFEIELEYMTVSETEKARLRMFFGALKNSRYLTVTREAKVERLLRKRKKSRGELFNLRR